ncbi:MAG: MBL fold metallo-hydrolase [Desulfobacteraceae bacterium]|nr:MBL fold metallo-hydrolase [Desulfobacteraceae bacterium]MBC2757782.1 MBL fold metallo-hydrolase [Desulfobacteraceae bacterium]MBC2763858.1 MBL fold metallo-hydrolase [ANME-2 cluster archaeon]
MHLEITSEIFQVGGSGYTAPEDAAIYLICFNEKSALVDAGCGNRLDRLYGNISECNINPETIEYLLITHCHYDHTGGAANVCKDLSCKTVAHKLDAQYLEKGNNTVTAADWYGSSIKPFTVDQKISNKQTDILLGDRKITAIHTPGHSPGSLVFLTESDGKKVLFGQDVHGPLAPGLKSNRKDYIASLEKMISLDADILCEGHFGIYTGKNKIRKFIKSFL